MLTLFHLDSAKNTFKSLNPNIDFQLLVISCLMCICLIQGVSKKSFTQQQQLQLLSETFFLRHPVLNSNKNYFPGFPRRPSSMDGSVLSVTRVIHHSSLSSSLRRLIWRLPGPVEPEVRPADLAVLFSVSSDKFLLSFSY